MKRLVRGARVGQWSGLRWEGVLPSKRVSGAMGLTKTTFVSLLDDGPAFTCLECSSADDLQGFALECRIGSLWQPTGH